MVAAYKTHGQLDSKEWIPNCSYTDTQQIILLLDSLHQFMGSFENKLNKRSYVHT